MSLQSFSNTFFDFVSSDPNFCVYNGLNKNLSDLPDPGKNKRIATQGKIKLLNKMLDGIKPQNKDEEIDIKLYRLYLEQYRLGLELEIDGVPQNMKMPRAAEAISSPLFMLFANDKRDPKLRLVNIISRLEKVDGFITSYCRNIKDPVKRWVDMELESVKTLPDFFETLLNWARSLEFKNMERLEKATKSARYAFSRYRAFLENSATSENIFIGEEQMHLVLKSMAITKTPEELHLIAKDFTTNNIKQIDELKEVLIKKHNLAPTTTSLELQEYLNENFQVKRSGKGFEYILERYKKEAIKVEGFIKEKDLFPLDIDQSMKIIQTPDFMVPTIPAGAMMPALPLREGTKECIVYLTLSENLVDEHTELTIPMMMIHEGIPGHHLQFAWAAENKSLIRKIYSAMDLSEGWTTMLEDYVIDQGYTGEYGDEMRFIGKRDLARIGARVAIDLYFMSGNAKFLDLGLDIDLSLNDPFMKAGALLKEVTGFVEDRIQGELNWYSQERGYPLCYLTGNYLMWDLKKKFLQKGFSDKEFHSKVLQAGNIPISILENYLLRN